MGKAVYKPGFHIVTDEKPPTPQAIEDEKLRELAKKRGFETRKLVATDQPLRTLDGYSPALTVFHHKKPVSSLFTRLCQLLRTH